MKPVIRKTVLRSFDKTVSCNCYYQQPGERAALPVNQEFSLIPRGAGMSYCSASALDGGLTVDMRLFNRVLNFDRDEGRVTVEAGICIGELNNYLIPSGWLLPVLPGYPMITVGGCIAFNVHGKSQYKIGLFMDWVEELVLYHPLKGEQVCSAGINEEIFNLTIGGMGFTGIIIQATLRLKKIAGNQVQIESRKVGNIGEAVHLMKEKAQDYDYVYSWNNFNLGGSSFGKGIVYLEKIMKKFSDSVKPVTFSNRLYPPKLTPALLNRFTTYWMCQVYYQASRLKPVSITQNLYTASFPIYGKEIYYHLFGKKGFREYQVIFPYGTWEEAMKTIKDLIQSHKIGITLASLKLFSGGTHHISFSGEGLCLAIDIPNSRESIAFFNEMDKVTISYNGIINLSKDSRAGAALVKACYPGYEKFRQAINNYDPQRLFVSELRNRLEI